MNQFSFRTPTSPFSPGRLIIFALELGPFDLEIRSEAAFEIPSSRNLARKPSRPPVVESCSELRDEFPFEIFHKVLSPRQQNRTLD